MSVTFDSIFLTLFIAYMKLWLRIECSRMNYIGLENLRFNQRDLMHNPNHKNSDDFRLSLHFVSFYDSTSLYQLYI